MTKLSINIITRNRKAELSKAVKSCLKNRIDNMEIIVVDNNSDDGENEEIKNLLKQSGMDFKYYYLNDNLGVAGGRNFAFEKSRGDFIFSLDDDAIIVTDDIFQYLVSRLENNTNLAAAGVKIYEPVTNRYIEGPTYTIDKSNKETYTLEYRGGAHILRKSVYEKTLPYPSKLDFGSEELYAGLVAFSKGYHVAFFDDLLVHHCPSNVERKVGNERHSNIMLNTHIVRTLCYPKILIPILNITYKIRQIKGGYSLSQRKKLRNLYKIRFSKSDISRMSLSKFILLIKYIGISKLL